MNIAIINNKNCPIIGKFSCKGYDTYGPFKLVGGIAKSHPNFIYQRYVPNKYANCC
ncbi:MAG: hypothetical protein U0K86_00580 [Agathobacter sp.]|nr:hypothetical protein [Agathobacter sp.]